VTRRWLLGCALALVSSLAATVAHAEVQDEATSRDVSAAERYAQYVYGTVGFDYSALSRDLPSEFQAQAHSRSVYALKTASLHFLNLWGYEAKFDYAATKLLQSAGFEEPRTGSPDTGNSATRFLLDLLTPYSSTLQIRTSGAYGIYRDEARVASRPVTYLSREGVRTTLPAGSNVTYDTRFARASVEVYMPFLPEIANHRSFVGYSYYDMLSAEWLELQQAQTAVPVLAGSHRSCHAISWTISPIEPRVQKGFSVYARTTMFFGAGTWTGGWFSNATSCAGQGGEFAARYLSDHIGIAIGIEDYDMTFLGGDTVVLTRSLAFETVDGDLRTAERGSTFSALSSGRFFYIGPFLRMSFGI
jgi:opacity protein-like surface antigen